MVMWFHMTTVSMQPWRIYPFSLIVYKSEPHNYFVTPTTVLVYISYVFGFGTFNDANTERTKAVAFVLQINDTLIVRSGYNRQCCSLYFLLLYFLHFHDRRDWE
ncbi:hypothetical protein Hanom_Chr05g00425091 [Helianthus anomalus]